MSQKTEDAPASGLVLHHLENSRSQRVLWLLEELGVPYTIKYYKRQPSLLAPPEMKAIHSLGKSPIITDGDLVVAESGAIIEYLLEKYANGRFQPPAAGKIKNLYYTHFAEGTIQPNLSNHLIFTLIGQRVPWFVGWIIRPVMEKVKDAAVMPNLRRAAELIEKDLEASPSIFFAGGDEPTSADFMMLFPMEVLPRAIGDSVGPKTKEWVEKVHARDAYKRALEKGGPYAYAKL